MRCLGSLIVLFAAMVSQAAPPDAPKELTATVKEPSVLMFMAPPDAKVARAQAFDVDKCFVARMWTDDQNIHNYMIFPKVPGEYRIVWWTVGEGTSTQTIITVPGTIPPPVPVPPVDPPPTPDPPTKPTSLYFLIIRPDGPASAEFTRIMSLPAWNELRTAGHVIKDKTLTDTKSWGYSPPTLTILPVVLTLDTRGGTSRIVRDPIPLPGTDAGIVGLPVGVK